VPYSFRLTQCSSATANDGALPYGLTVASITSTIHTLAGIDATAEMVESDFYEVLVYQARLNYPTTTGAGSYHLSIVVTFLDGSTKQLDFDRIVAV
jgi:hypothetical protein